MRLRKIEIVGFKSFADRTVFLFDMGLTAIVGPNGCGKSNVADAFRWVMGEQSARSLRGSKMADVIFAGTTQRKPQNFAEVTITLTDINGELPIDYDEVSVTRRLHRSGESEYFINEQSVRLKDVQELLMDSGIGNDAYAIFEQGKIDEVIKLPPLERRYIFEEAAGIKRFLQRKKEALRKLEQTKGNVDRVRDIHREIERQVVVLEKQAEEAKEYKTRKAELAAWEKSLLAAKWYEWERRKKGLEEKITAIDGILANITAKSDALQEQMAHRKQLLAIEDKAYREHSENVFRLRSAKEIHGKEQENCLARMEELKQKELRWGNDLEVLQQRRVVWQEEKEVLAATVKKLEGQQKDHDKALDKQRAFVNKAEEGLKSYRSSLQQKQKALQESMHKLQGVQSELKQLEIRIENAHEREKYLQSRKQLLLEQKNNAEAYAKEYQKAFDALLTSIEEKRVLLTSLEEQLSGNVAQLDEVQGHHEKIVKDLTDARARYKVIKALQEDMEGFSAGTQKLLSESDKASSPLYNKLEALYPYFVAKKGAEKAIAAVMSAYGQTLVVETQDDFNKVVAYAKKQGITDFSLVCLENIPALKGKKGRTAKDARLLTDYVEENAVAHYFLSHIDIQADVSVLGQSDAPAVRFDGIYTDGCFVTFFPKVEGVSVFLRESEIKELDKAVGVMEKERVQLEQLIRSMQLKRKELQTAIVVADKDIRQLEIKSAEVKVSLQKYGVDQERIEAERKKISGEIDTTVQAIKGFMEVQKECSASVATMKKDVTLVQGHVDAATSKYEEMTLEVNAQAKALRQVEMARQELLDEIRRQLNAINVIDAKEVESQQQKKRIVDELEVSKGIQKHLSQKKKELEKTLVGDGTALSDGLAVKALAEEAVAKRHQEIAGLQVNGDHLAKDSKKQQELRHQVQVQVAQTDVQMQAVARELHERHDLDAKALEKMRRDDDQNLEALETSVKRLRQQLEGANAINMTSIEEFEQCQQRHKEMSVQLTDMGAAEKELMGIIAELDGESRQLFQETFVKVRENFQKNFSLLFTGGEADLQFVDSDDILEAGIEIVAKPPGKHMRSISLLSGGEKCLTAMALLFAIFEVKPAPFCILDEIDAPLDDANVDRFVHIVKKFSEVCQFLIITHNKRTMSIADKIFGVSMEEKGVSKLLTIDLSKKRSKPARELATR